MNWNNNAELGVDPEDLELVLWNIPNEVLRGFHVDHFEERIGTATDNFLLMAERWHSKPRIEIAMLEVHEASCLRNALDLMLDELGEDEFQTRTGCDFDKGRFILQVLDRYIAECAQS